MARKVTACAAAFILLALFIALLAAYARPMEDEVYDQSDSAGFINLFGLPIKVKAMADAKAKKNGCGGCCKCDK